MESLAFVVVVIFVGVFALAISSAIMAIVNPQRTWARVLGVVIAVPTVAVGVWMWWVTDNDALAGRVWAAAIMLVGAAALIRCVRRG